MATAVVRVDADVHDRLKKLSEAENRPIGQIVGDLVARYEKEQFWAEMHAAFERLRADPEAWADYQAEVQLWEAASADTLKDEPPYYTPEEEEEIREHFARTYGGGGVGGGDADGRPGT